MSIHFGFSLYGKVDQVPGLFHVATRFFHLNFFPLIPTGSFIVMEGTQQGDDFTGYPIGLNFKSLMFAWTRVLLLIGGAAALIWAVVMGVEALNGQGDGWLCVAGLIFGAVLIALFIVSYRLTRAAPLRALVLARTAGIPPESVAPYFLNHAGLEEALTGFARLPSDSSSP